MSTSDVVMKPICNCSWCNLDSTPSIYDFKGIVPELNPDRIVNLKHEDNNWNVVMPDKFKNGDTFFVKLNNQDACILENCVEKECRAKNIIRTYTDEQRHELVGLLFQMCYMESDDSEEVTHTRIMEELEDVFNNHIRNATE